MKPARYQGRRMKVLEDGQTEAFSFWSKGYSETEGVPDGYKLDSYGDVVPLNMWEPSEEQFWDETGDVPDACWEPSEESSSDETCVGADKSWERPKEVS